MVIDIKEYLLNYVGHTDWWGESNYDDVSSYNLNKLDEILTEIEELREELKSKLTDHIVYRKENASSKHLHDKAKMIMERHIIKEFTHTDFKKYWEDDDD